MIVMKFGGSSLATACSIKRVISIIRSETAGHSVVAVASAMGDTTDVLMEVLSAARKADRYTCWKLQEDIKTRHFDVCDELLLGAAHSSIDQYFRDTFRDLHVRILEVSSGERCLTPELQDWVLSLGEQLSSRVLAAVLQEHGGNTVHLDSRKLILTDSTFGNAKPQYWETYARIRWSIPIASRDNVVVVGGFIGGTEDVRTTTLGRGGSDLTAAIIGAAVNAEEIQVWKDVNGMLTCDPRLRPGGYQVKRLSYEEATELANAGATILHPETMMPAKRLRIPIVIRNTFCPSAEGTRIEGRTSNCSTLVKSVAVKNNITLLEARSADQADDLEALISFCREHSSVATVVSATKRTLYVAVEESAKMPDESRVNGSCLDVRIRTGQALLTLVGHIADRETISNQLTATLQGLSAFIIPSENSPFSIRLVVAQRDLKKCLDLVHEAFFSSPDLRFFTAATTKGSAHSSELNVPLPTRWDKPRAFVPSTQMLVPN